MCSGGSWVTCWRASAQREACRKQALAEGLRRPQSFVSKIEGGQRRLEVIELLELATVMDVDVGEFVTQSPDDVGKP